MSPLHIVDFVGFRLLPEVEKEKDRLSNFAGFPLLALTVVGISSCRDSPSVLFYCFAIVKVVKCGLSRFELNCEAFGFSCNFYARVPPEDLKIV